MSRRRAPKGRRRDALVILKSSLERCIGGTEGLRLTRGGEKCEGGVCSCPVIARDQEDRGGRGRGRGKGRRETTAVLKGDDKLQVGLGVKKLSKSNGCVSYHIRIVVGA